MTENNFMSHAISLAEKGRWFTAPNPCVGAVLVFNDTVIASGYHTKYGTAHAEVECLIDAIKKGYFSKMPCSFSNPLLAQAYQENKKESKKESKEENNEEHEALVETFSIEQCTLYVTLEPCNHEGKTPPCTKAIVESGIGHVVIGMRDPNPKASGGVDYLEKNGVCVTCGVLEKECKVLLEDFFTWQIKKRPYVILKMACSLDGRIGPKIGHNHRISGDKSHDVLMQLRENIAIAGGAVMVGANTFLHDAPKLTVRKQGYNPLTQMKQPYAVIVASDLSKILHHAGQGNFLGNKSCLLERPHETLLYTSHKSIQEFSQLQKKQVFCKVVEYKDNQLNLEEVFASLYEEKNCPYVLCEGGAKLAMSLIKQGFVDELILYMSPIIMGDERSKAVFSGNFVQSMQDVYSFNIFKTAIIGEDLHIHLKADL